MKQLLMPISMGMTIRNLLRGPLLNKLSDDFIIELVSPFYDNKNFVKEFGGTNVIFNRVSQPKFKERLTSILYQWQYYALWQKKRPETVAKYIERDKIQSFYRYLGNSMGGALVNQARSNRRKDWIRDIAMKYPLKKKYPDSDAIFLSSTDLISELIKNSDLLKIQYCRTNKQTSL